MSAREATTSNMPKIIIDSHHPKHYLTLRQLGKRCRDAGIEVIWTGREKDVLIDLMREDGLDPHVLTTARRGLLGKMWELALYDWRLARLAYLEKPFAMIGKTISIAHVGRLLGIPSIVINDDSASSNPQFRFLAYPFAHRIVTSDILQESWGRRHRTFHGYLHLAYLHPHVFRPDEGIRAKLGVDGETRIFVVRLAAFQAYHDVGASGLGFELLRSLLERLDKSGRIFISSEKHVPQEFERYRIPVSPGLLHHVLAAADLVIGDGLSVCVEAALLGTPAIAVGSYVADHAPYELWRQLQDRYRLMFCYTAAQPEHVLSRVDNLLAERDLKTNWAERRSEFLREWIDPTEVFWEEVTTALNSSKLGALTGASAPSRQL